MLKQSLEKAATMKRFEYLPSGKQLKPQTDIAKKKKKQYKKLDNTYQYEKIIKKENPKLKKKKKRSNLMYDSKYSFYPYYNDKKFNSLSLTSKYPILYSFY